MADNIDSPVAVALDWALQNLHDAVVVSDHTKEHAGHDSGIRRLRTAEGPCFVKVHDNPAFWHNEVHGYENWAHAFGDRAPRLLAVRDEPPLALIVTELPGRVLEHIELPPEKEREVWRAAGEALVALHDLGPGETFGPCLRDGAPAGEVATDAVSHVTERFRREIERGVAGGYIDAGEEATCRAALALTPAFAGEKPTPCHRDYCAANLLVDDAGRWAGVIDFEFAYWDVRVADLTRDPHWHYITCPDMYEAYLEGYGRPFTAAEEQQLLVAHAEYALGAILWGHDGAFYGFEREGREALVHLAPLLQGD